MRAVAYLTSVVGLSLVLGFALVFGITFRAEVWEFTLDHLPYRCKDILGFSGHIGYRCLSSNGISETTYFFPEQCREELIRIGKNNRRIEDECGDVPISRFEMHRDQWRKMLNWQ